LKITVLVGEGRKKTVTGRDGREKKNIDRPDSHSRFWGKGELSKAGEGTRKLSGG